MCELADARPNWSRRASSRRLLAVGLSLLLLVPLVRFSTLAGLVRPVRVTGGSMATSYLGAHYRVPCADCGMLFPCGVEFAPADGLVVCPNCGFTENRLEGISITAGRRVILDRWANWMRSPQPGQSVAFRHTDDSHGWAIKRLLARGPAELEIRDGQLLRDGQLVRKSLDQLRQVCVLVHDDRFRPQLNPELPPRWLPATTASLWSTTPAGYRYLPPASHSETPPLHWLQYRQWTCWPHPFPIAARTASHPILDHYGYNQSLSRGALHPVHDILLRVRITLRGTGSLVLQLHDGTDCFQLVINHPARVPVLHHNGRPVETLPPLTARQPWDIEFTVCDQRVMAALQRETFLCHPFEPSSQASRETAAPVAVGARGVQVELEAPQIFRDIHYFGPAGQRRWRPPQPLTADECFVLGDNVPISVDSRFHGPVRRDSLIGPVIP